MTAFSPPPLSPAFELALESLVSCHPIDLSRVAKLREVHAVCVSAGVVDGSVAAACAEPGSSDADGARDVARLHSLFHAAVTHGAAQLVCHYVDEVCGRDDFSSPDGVEAYLRDGEMVAEWAVSATRAAERVLLDASANASATPQAAADAAEAAASDFEATKDVLTALGASNEFAGEPVDTSGRDAHRNANASSSANSFRTRLQHARDDCVRGESHAVALSWLLRSQLGGVTTVDRHGGPAAWTGSVRTRRAANSDAARGDGGVSLGVPAMDGGALFLDDLLTQVSTRPPPYPFKSATEAAERIFSAGSATPNALIAKRCLFVYYLLDAGAPVAGAPASFARVVKLSPKLFSQTVAACYLDDWDKSDTSLDEACVLVPKLAQKSLPARFVASLVARGRPRAALDAARARGPPELQRVGDGESFGDAHSTSDEHQSDAYISFAEECDLTITVRLECGLATEAFLVANHVLASAPAAFADELATRLASRLASHAASRNALASILELPFSGSLERGLLAWLRGNCGVAPGAPAHLTVSYFLQRGRAVEAASEASLTAPPLPSEVKQDLEQALRALPDPQRRLRLDGAAAAAAVAGETRSLAVGVATATAAPNELAQTAFGCFGADSGVGVGSGSGGPSFDPAGGTLCVLDGPFQTSSLGNGNWNGCGGRPPFFAPPVFARYESSSVRLETKNRPTRHALGGDATKNSSSGLQFTTKLGSPNAQNDGDQWTQLKFGETRVGLGAGEDFPMCDAAAIDGAEILPNETVTVEKDRRGAPAKESAKRGSSIFVSPFGRQPLGSLVTRSGPNATGTRNPPYTSGAYLVPKTPGRQFADSGIGPHPGTTNAKARLRWAPPPKFGAGGTPGPGTGTGKEFGNAGSAGRKSPGRSSSRHVNKDTSQVVAMEHSGGGGALLAGVVPIAASKTTRNSPAPKSLFHGTSRPAGTPGVTRATPRSSSRFDLPGPAPGNDV